MYNRLTKISQSIRARLSEDRTHLRALTGIRGWAAMWVLLYHGWVFADKPPLYLDVGAANLNLTPLASMGIAGVTIFFVLSGFLLGQPFAQWQAGHRQRPAIGRYFIHRIARVFPAYYVQLIILLLLAYLVAGRPGIPDTAATLIRYLFMLFVPPPVGTTPMNLVWWTLPIEFSFYLVLPALVFMLRPARWWWLLIFSLVAMWGWRYSLITWLADAPIPQRVYASYQLPGSFDMFGLGMLASLLHVNRDRIPDWVLPRGDSSRLAVLGAVLVIVAGYWLFGERRHYWANNPIFYLWTPALSLGTAAVVLAAARKSRLTEWLFGNRIMVFAGLVSYSVYLWHVEVMSWITNAHLIHTGGGYRYAMVLMLTIPLIYLISTLSYMLVERPFIRMGRK